jgi:hypothetical protein
VSSVFVVAFFIVFCFGPQVHQINELVGHKNAK